MTGTLCQNEIEKASCQSSYSINCNTKAVANLPVMWHKVVPGPAEAFFPVMELRTFAYSCTHSVGARAVHVGDHERQNAFKTHRAALCVTLHNRFRTPGVLTVVRLNSRPLVLWMARGWWLMELLGANIPFLLIVSLLQERSIRLRSV